MTHDEVYALIQGERTYQKALWPGHKHSYREYLIYIRDYLAEALHLESRFQANDDRTKAIVRKVAAMCKAALEEHSHTFISEGSYFSADSRSLSQPLIIWLADMACRVERTFLKSDNGFYPEGTLCEVYILAAHCMEEHGAPARDIAGDLAKRQKTVPVQARVLCPSCTGCGYYLQGNPPGTNLNIQKVECPECQGTGKGEYQK